MAGEVDVHAVLVEEVLHGGLEALVDGSALVQRVVALREDPGAKCTVLVGFD